MPTNPISGQPDYKTLIEHSPDVIFTVTREGVITAASPASLSLWGYAPEALYGRTVCEFLSGFDVSRIKITTGALQEDAATTKFEVNVRCSTGKVRPCICSCRWHADGQQFHCVARDGSDKSRIREKAKQSEKRLENASRLARVAWWERTPPGEAITTSETLYEIYGISREAFPVFTRDVYLSLVHPDDLNCVRQYLSDASKPDTYQYVHRLIRPDGKLVYLNHLVQLKRNAAGDLVQVHGTTTDITELKQYEENLQQTRKRYLELLETIGDSFFVVDENYRVTYWNSKAENVTGLKKEYIINRNFFEAYPRARQTKFPAEFSKAFTTGAPVHFLEHSTTYDAWIEVDVYPGSEGLAVHVRDVTASIKEKQEKEKLNEQLNQANQRLLTVLESMSDGFFTVDKEWKITFATDRVAAMLGVDKSDYLGRVLWDCFPEIKDSLFDTEYHRAMRENTLVTFEEYNARFDMWFEVNAYPDPEGLSIFVKDISGRKQQEAELIKSNQRFESAARATSDVIWDHDLDSGNLYINPSFTKLFGHEIPAEASAKRALWEKMIHPDDRQLVLHKLQTALSDPSVTTAHQHYRFYKANGEVAYVTDRAVIIRDERGKATRMIGAIKDITEKKLQSQRLEFLSKATSEVIWQRQVDSETAEINGERFTQIFGYDVGNEISVEFWKSKLHPGDREALMEKLERTVEQGLSSFVQEYRFKKADGSWAYVRDRTLLLRDESGKPATILSAMEDVTRERLAEQALYQSRENYKQLFNSSPLPVFLVDLETFAILDVNDTCVKHYGYSREELLTKTTLDLRSRKDYRSFKAKVAQLKEKGFSVWQTTHLTTRGKIYVEATNCILDYEGRKVMLGVINDITEKRKLQKALIDAEVNHQKNITKTSIEAQEKERSNIGKELHDNVNQILTSAKLYLENSKYVPEKADQFIEKSVSYIVDSINEIRRLSKALITPTIADVGLKETLIELVEGYLQLNLFHVRLRYKVDEARVPPGVQLTVYRILQEAFNNTVKYAKAREVVLLVLEKNGTILIRYRDDGIGFDSKTVKKGLGLENIRNRIEAYNGFMNIESKPGKGVRLSISLPTEASAEAGLR